MASHPPRMCAALERALEVTESCSLLYSYLASLNTPGVLGVRAWWSDERTAQDAAQTMAALLRQRIAEAMARSQEQSQALRDFTPSLNI